MGGSKKKAVKEKPLDKMTVKELRDLAKESTDLTGVYGMNKPELVTEIKKARGIVEEVSGKTNTTVREIKKKMREADQDAGNCPQAPDSSLGLALFAA